MAEGSAERKGSAVFDLESSLKKSWVHQQEMEVNGVGKVVHGEG